MNLASTLSIYAGGPGSGPTAPCPQCGPHKGAGVPASKVHQQWQTPDGATFTIIKPHLDTTKAPRNLAQVKHGLHGQFGPARGFGTDWVKGVTDKPGTDMIARVFDTHPDAVKGTGFDKGTTVWVYRYMKGNRPKGIKVVEMNYDQDRHRFGKLYAFDYKNAGSALTMLKRRYGIRGLPV